jgi:hypothetical protein
LDSSDEATRREVSGAVAFGPRSDFVLHLLEQQQEESIYLLAYEGLHRTWTLIYDGCRLKIATKDQLIIPTVIYVRGVVIEPSHPLWEDIAELLEIIDLWKGPVVGRPSSQQYNESKLYQLTQSLMPAAKNCPSLRFPKSWVCKGAFNPNNYKNTIVKSLSGIRSMVVSQKVYTNWLNDTIDVPVLFQEQVDGGDLRVHFLNDETWGIFVQAKSEVDYRYSAARSQMKEYKINDDLAAFTKAVAQKENGVLIGFDFLVSESGVYPLEANPGPGWAWYHRVEVCSRSFIQSFVQFLKSFSEGKNSGPNPTHSL